MGYDLHITRKDDWTDENGPVITAEEWRALIDSDPELELDSDTRCVMSDGEFVFATWNGQAGVLGHYAGEITSKNPDESLIAKMIEIANRLGAKVQGDDGEMYPDALETQDVDRQRRGLSSLWQRLFGG